MVEALNIKDQNAPLIGDVSEIPDELPSQSAENLAKSAFENYRDIFLNPITFSEKEIIDLMKQVPFGGITRNGEFFDRNKVLAYQTANEFNGRFPGAGNYRELVSGTSKFAPGVKMTDKRIIETFTDLEDKGFLEALGTRLLENVPITTSGIAGFLAGKKIQKFAPKFNQKITTGLPGGKALDKVLNKLQTAYNVGVFSIPYLTGIGSSVFSAPLGEPFGELFLGDKKTFTPETYGTMRTAEFTGDVLSAGPFIYFGDKAATNYLRDYLTNRLSFNGMGRAFDLGVGANKSLNQQIKEAQKAITTSLGGDKRMQGPVDVTTLLERGVANVLQDKLPPKIMNRLLTIEDALVRTGQQARASKKNAALLAFYEALATATSLPIIRATAEQAPGSGYETLAEVLSPVTFGFTQPIMGSAINSSLKFLKELFTETKAGGLKGFTGVFRDKIKDKRDQKAFDFLIDKLDKTGSLDGDNLKNLINLLEKKVPSGAKLTAGAKTLDPAILAIEAAIAKDFPDMAAAQKEQMILEKQALQNILTNLGLVDINVGGVEALRKAAELQQAIFTTTINKRLNDAEDTLLQSFNRLKGIRGRDRFEVTEDPKGKGPTVKGKEAFKLLNDADRMELSDRLTNLVNQQMLFARNKQKKLYQEVGNFQFDRNMFFNDDGSVANAPKFVQYAESILPEKPEFSDTYKQLKTVLFDFVRKTDSQGNQTGVAVDLERGDTVSLRALNEQRSELLAIARDGTKNEKIRSFAGKMAEAIQDDLNNFTQFAGMENQPDLFTGSNKRQIQALKTANAYSKAFADVFYRSFVGDMMKNTKEGGFRIAPELLHESFKSDKFDPNYLKIMDIMNVGDFITDYKIREGASNIKTTNKVLERILKQIRADTYDPTTKKISREKMQDWINNNNRLQKVFPDLFEDLDNFINKSKKSDSVIFNTKKQEATVNKQINFTTLLFDNKGKVRDDPTTAISEALIGGSSQARNLDALIDVIPKKGETKKATIYELTDNKTGFKETFFDENDAKEFLSDNPDFKMDVRNITVDREKAMEGFKASVFEFFINGQNKFNAPEPKFKFFDIYNKLFEKKVPTVGRNPRTGAEVLKKETLSDYFLRKGVFTKGDVDTAKRALEELIKLEAVDASQLIDIAFEEAKPIMDFAVSIGGSALGTRSQALLTGDATGPGSIIAAGRGAELARNLFLRMPAISKKLFLGDLLQDPILLASMLRQYGEGKQAKGVISTIQNYLIKNGYVDAPRKIGVGVIPDDEPRGEESFMENKVEVQQPPVNITPTPPMIENNRSIVQSGPPINLSQVNPPAQIPTPTPQAQAQPSSGSADPNTRTRYASLFPDDPISGMLGSGGITNVRTT